jgi:hypothetical protein
MEDEEGRYSAVLGSGQYAVPPGLASKFYNSNIQAVVYTTKPATTTTLKFVEGNEKYYKIQHMNRFKLKKVESTKNSFK